MARGWGYNYGFNYGGYDPTTFLVPSERAPYVDLSNNFNPIPRPLAVTSLYDAPVSVGGAFTDVSPVQEQIATLNGDMQFSFVDDFYHRFYVIPSSVDLGVVTEPTTVTISVWNAHLTPAIVSEVSEVLIAPYNVSTSGVSAPATIPALSVQAMYVLADDAGPSEINGSITFSFNPLQSISVPVTGVRGRLWPFNPNWIESVTETWEYRTEIIVARSGREQRRAMRTTPRKSLQYRTTVTGDKRRKLAFTLDKHHPVGQVVADLSRFATSTSVVPAIAGSFTVDLVPDWIAIGTRLVCISGDTVDLRYVSAIAGTTITVQNDGDADMPVGTKLHYGFIGNFEDVVSVDNPTDDVAQVMLQYKVSPGSEDAIEPSAASATHNGRPVLTLKPNWGTSLGIDFEQPVNSIDYGRGKTSRYTPITFSSRVTKWAFLNRGKSELAEVTDMFIRAKGQRGEFYMPTWQNDMVMRSAVASTGTGLRVVGREIYEGYESLATFGDVVVRLKSGATIYRTVTGITPIADGLGSDSYLQMSSTWGVNINPVDVEMICWLPIVRFASDALTIEWLTNEVSQTQITTRTLENLAAEA